MYINPIGNYKINNVVLNANSKQPSTSNKNVDINNIPSFNGIFSDIFVKKFSTDAENNMYKELSSVLSGKDKTNFDILYKTGRLADRNSNDKSSTLENLYKIYKNPRVQGLNSEKVLSETIERIANPFVITQKFGKLPQDLALKVLKDKQENLSGVEYHPHNPKNVNDMNIKNSASCVAASIEFSLADKKPAEFARMAEGLSSPELAVNHRVKLSNLNKSPLNSFTLFNMFLVSPENTDWVEATIKIKPDRDAIIRARVQNTYANKKTRGSVDVLFQSAFMQLGSQSTYNSLTDKRYGSLNANDTGLTEFEKTFVESVVNNDGEKTSMVYQNVNQNAVLEGYFYPPETVEQHLLKTLKTNRNIIVGITETDANKKIIGGHEITIINSKIKNNELYFVCNDTDDDYSGPVEIKSSDLIPKIHHAGIPVDILEVAPQAENRGKDLLKQYNASNDKNPTSNSAA